MGVPHGRPGPANKAAILGIPFDCGTNMRIGARGGPDLVRQQSALMRRFNPTHADFDPVAALGLVDCGNVRLTPSKIVDAFERTEQAVDRIVAAGAVPVTIGGDGSVTVPVARAVGKKYPKMAALHINSHTNSYPYGEEEKYNSATQFTHVAEEGLVDPEFSWHVGIRSTTYAQGVVPRAMSLGYKIVSLDELIRGGFAQRMAEFRDKVGKRPVYLCFDMDVFDPSVRPRRMHAILGRTVGARRHRPAALPDRPQHRGRRRQHGEPAAGRERHGGAPLRPRHLRNAGAAQPPDGTRPTAASGHKTSP